MENPRDLTFNAGVIDKRYWTLFEKDYACDSFYVKLALYLDMKPEYEEVKC